MMGTLVHVQFTSNKVTQASVPARIQRPVEGLSYRTHQHHHHHHALAVSPEPALGGNKIIQLNYMKLMCWL